MRGNQAVEVVAGWACLHSRDEIRLSSKPTFRIDGLRLHPSALFETVPMKPQETLNWTGNQLLYGSLRSGKPGVRHDEELEYLGPSDHLRTLRQ